jgi:hypothetical protein
MRGRFSRVVGGEIWEIENGIIIYKTRSSGAFAVNMIISWL